MISMIITLSEEALKEIRKEAFINNVSVSRLIELLLGLGLDVFTGRVAISEAAPPEKEE